MVSNRIETSPRRREQGSDAEIKWEAVVSVVSRAGWQFDEVVFHNIYYRFFFGISTIS
jgi:hypothetical protein